MFRDLRADEIDCRVATCSDKGCSLLLYKDARVDMNILDEEFSMLGWQREHQLIGDRLYCTVKVKDKSTGEWISKQDVGTESYTEKEKGQASDSFKRACFNIGIGRELYTAPFIWINASDVNLTQKNGKWTTYDRFEVGDITITDKKITGLTIINARTKKTVYTYGKQASATKQTSKPTMINQEAILTITRLANDQGIDLDSFVKSYGVNKLEEMTRQQSIKAYNDLIARSVK
jgi:hypothetical protein